MSSDAFEESIPTCRKVGSIRPQHNSSGPLESSERASRLQLPATFGGSGSVQLHGDKIVVLEDFEDPPATFAPPPDTAFPEARDKVKSQIEESKIVSEDLKKSLVNLRKEKLKVQRNNKILNGDLERLRNIKVLRTEAENQVFFVSLSNDENVVADVHVQLVE